MLYLYVKKKSYEDLFTGIDETFDFDFELDWLNNNQVIDIIKDIDGNEIVGKTIISQQFGEISYTWLSTGAKMLILLTVDDYENDAILNGNQCGDNCSEWLLKIAEEKDIHMHVSYFKEFILDGTNHDIHLIDRGVVSTDYDYNVAMFTLLGAND